MTGLPLPLIVSPSTFIELIISYDMTGPRFAGSALHNKYEASVCLKAGLPEMC